MYYIIWLTLAFIISCVLANALAVSIRNDRKETKNIPILKCENCNRMLDYSKSFKWERVGDNNIPTIHCPFCNTITYL